MTYEEVEKNLAARVKTVVVVSKTANSQVVSAYNGAANSSEAAINSIKSVVDGLSVQEAKDTFAAMGFRASPSWSGAEIKRRIYESIVNRRGSFIRSRLLDRPGQQF